MVACLTTWGTAWPPACVPNTGGPNLRGRWGGGGSHTRETTNGAAEHSSSQWTASCASISSSVHQFTNTQIQIHKYKHTNSNTQVQMHKHKCTNSSSQRIAWLCVRLASIMRHTVFTKISFKQTKMPKTNEAKTCMQQ